MQPARLCFRRAGRPSRCSPRPSARPRRLRRGDAARSPARCGSGAIGRRRCELRRRAPGSLFPPGGAEINFCAAGDMVSGARGRAGGPPPALARDVSRAAVPCRGRAVSEAADGAAGRAPVRAVGIGRGRRCCGSRPPAPRLPSALAAAAGERRELPACRRGRVPSARTAAAGVPVALPSSSP